MGIAYPCGDNCDEILPNFNAQALADALAAAEHACEDIAGCRQLIPDGAGGGCEHCLPEPTGQSCFTFDPRCFFVT